MPKEITGDHVTITEDYVIVSGDYAVVHGNLCTIYGNHGTIIGNGGTIIGDYGYISGENGVIRGMHGCMPSDSSSDEEERQVRRAIAVSAESFYNETGTRIPLDEEYTRRASVAEVRKSALPFIPETKDDENEDCIICTVRQDAYAFVPCGHQGVCSTCYNKLVREDNSTCPICNKKIESVLKVFKCGSGIGKS